MLRLNRIDDYELGIIRENARFSQDKAEKWRIWKLTSGFSKKGSHDCWKKNPFKKGGLCPKGGKDRDS
jgi:hypothetical protein